jgi:hypothetical protein
VTTYDPSSVAITGAAFVNSIGALLITLNIGLPQATTAAIGVVLNAGFGFGWAIYKATRRTAPPAAS